MLDRLKREYTEHLKGNFTFGLFVIAILIFSAGYTIGFGMATSIIANVGFKIIQQFGLETTVINLVNACFAGNGINKALNDDNKAVDLNLTWNTKQNSTNYNTS